MKNRACQRKMGLATGHKPRGRVPKYRLRAVGIGVVGWLGGYHFSIGVQGPVDISLSACSSLRNGLYPNRLPPPPYATYAAACCVFPILKGILFQMRRILLGSWVDRLCCRFIHPGHPLAVGAAFVSLTLLPETSSISCTASFRGTFVAAQHSWSSSWQFYAIRRVARI